MADKTKIRVTNPNPFIVGSRKVNDVPVTVQPNSFVFMSADDIYYAHSIATTFTRQFLIIEDDEINEELGFPTKPVIKLSSEEIKTLLKGNIQKLKEALPEGSEKHIVDKFVSVAATIDDLARNKVDYLEQTFGVSFETVEKMKSEK